MYRVLMCQKPIGKEIHVTTLPRTSAIHLTPCSYRQIRFYAPVGKSQEAFHPVTYVHNRFQSPRRRVHNITGFTLDSSVSLLPLPGFPTS